MTQLVRALFVSDWHVPRHHGAFLDAVVGFTREVKVDVLIPGGDLSDMAPASRFKVLIENDAGHKGQVEP